MDPFCLFGARGARRSGRLLGRFRPGGSEEPCRGWRGGQRDRAMPFERRRPLQKCKKTPNLANPPTSYRSLSGPPGPKSPKSLKKVSRGLRPRGPQKSRKSPEQTFSRLFPDFSDFFETFSRLLGTPGPEAPGDFFQTFWGSRAQRARETPVARWGIRNPNPPNAVGSAWRGAGRNGVPGKRVRNTRGKLFSEHFPEHPVSGQHLSKHSSEHFWGVGGLLQGVAPFATQSLCKLILNTSQMHERNNSTMRIPLTFFRAPEKKNFLWGDPVQNRPQNPAPAGCHFSTTKNRSEVPEGGDFGEENCVGKGGADKAKKGKKDAQKKVGPEKGDTA